MARRDYRLAGCVQAGYIEATHTFKGCFGGGTPRRDVRYISQKQHYGVFITALEIKTVSTFAYQSTAYHAREVLATKSVTLAVSSRRTFLEGVLRNYVTSANVRMSFCESCRDEGLPIISLDRVEVHSQFRVCTSSIGLGIHL